MNRYNIPDADIRSELTKRGLECHLLTAQQPGGDFPDRLCAEIKSLMREAYQREDITPMHLLDETWCVTLREIHEPHAVVASATLSFCCDMPSFFTTRFEAVHPRHQRTGLGRMLYRCIESWTKFLIFNDPLVTHGVLVSKGDYCLVSCIDAPEWANRVVLPVRHGWDSVDYPEDNEQGHGAFLQKLGFVRALHDFHQTEQEIAFQRAFHVPVEAEEAALSLDNPSTLDSQDHASQ